MKIRRRAHPIHPSKSTPRNNPNPSKRLPTGTRMVNAPDVRLYNGQGELIDRQAIQAQVAARTAANRVQAAANGTLKVEPEQPKAVQTETSVPKTLSPLQAFKAAYSKSPWFISVKGASNGHDSLYLTAADSAKDGDIPETFQGKKVRVTYVRRGSR